jgi:hypothetical protein
MEKKRRGYSGITHNDGSAVQNFTSYATVSSILLLLLLLVRRY